MVAKKKKAKPTKSQKKTTKKPAKVKKPVKKVAPKRKAVLSRKKPLAKATVQQPEPIETEQETVPQEEVQESFVSPVPPLDPKKRFFWLPKTARQEVDRMALQLPTRPVLKPIGVKPPMAVAPPVVEAPKAPRKASEAMEQYRKLKKYTAPKLQAFINATAELRAAIGQPHDADSPLAAWELLEYLNAVEGELPSWKQPKSPTGRKRGRPAKVKPATPPSANAAATIAAASNGSLVRPPAFAATVRKPLMPIIRRG